MSAGICTAHQNGVPSRRVVDRFPATGLLLCAFVRAQHQFRSEVFCGRGREDTNYACRRRQAIDLAFLRSREGACCICSHEAPRNIQETLGETFCPIGHRWLSRILEGTATYDASPLALVSQAGPGRGKDQLYFALGILVEPLSTHFLFDHQIPSLP